MTGHRLSVDQFGLSSSNAVQPVRTELFLCKTERQNLTNQRMGKKDRAGTLASQPVQGNQACQVGCRI